MSALTQPIVAWWMRFPPNLRGILWITMGTLAFAFNDVMVKSLGRRLDPIELTLIRYVTGLIILSPVFVRVGVSKLATSRLRWHALRLAFAGAAQVGVIYSVVNLPLANATALSFSRVLFTPFVAVWIVKELVSRGRWTAIAIGFAGVLIMARPDQSGIDPITIVAIVSALCFAVSNVLIRRISDTEPPIRILFYYHLGGALVFAIPAAVVWQTPVGVEWWYVVGNGGFTTLAMVGFVRGFAVGEASVIGPMEYTRLIYAAILGFMIFNESPDPWSILGALIIVGATTYIARMEARSAARGAG